jgi:hypothetical protein
MAKGCEKLCKDRFNSFLVEQGFNDIKWVDLSEKGIDPPDYSLFFNGKEYAVEVTEMSVSRETSLDSQVTILDKEYINSHIELAKNIENIAIDKGILHGAYALNFFAPIAGKYFNKISKLVESEVLKFVYYTKDFEETQRENIIINKTKICNIRKIKASVNMIKALFTRFAWDYAPETISTLTNLIQKAVDDKIKKLSNTNIKEPKILLIKDTWILSNFKAYEMTKKDIFRTEYFCMIYIVLDLKIGYLYYRQE